jgi:hypothetical protein
MEIEVRHMKEACLPLLKHIYERGRHVSNGVLSKLSWHSFLES